MPAWEIGGVTCDAADGNAPLQSSRLPTKGPLKYVKHDFVGSLSRSATGTQRIGRKSPEGVLNFWCTTACKDELEALEGTEIVIDAPDSIDASNRGWKVLTFECYDWLSNRPWSPGRHYVTLELIGRELAV